MEILKLAKLPVEALKFAGHQLLGGAWAELPPLPQGPYEAPKRASASITYYSTPEVPENIHVGQE